MKSIKSLSDKAKEFWKAHYNELKRAGIITARDTESFILLCQIWGKLQELDMADGNFRTMTAFINLVKQYQSLAKQFGLLPRERKLAGMDSAEAEKDEFGL